MQGYYPCNSVLYSYGSTADQTEATEMKFLPADTLKSGGVHGESLFACPLPLHGRSWCYQKTGQSPLGDMMLSDSIMMGLADITTAMTEAKEHHFWEINICSLQTNKRTK